MNGMKLSLALLVTAACAVNAEAPKKEAPKPAAAKPAAPLNYLEGGKKAGTLLSEAITSNNPSGQMEYAKLAQEYIAPLYQEFQKGEKDTPEAKAAWKKFQDFQRGLKETFEKAAPKVPAGLSDIEKEMFALGIESTKVSFNVALSSKNLEEYNKTMQEKQQAFMTKHLELQKKMREAQQAAQAKPAEAAKS